jgi:hypothetical protein
MKALNTAEQLSEKLVAHLLLCVKFKTHYYSRRKKARWAAENPLWHRWFLHYKNTENSIAVTRAWKG